VAIHGSFAMTQIITKKSKTIHELYANECIMTSAEILSPEKQQLLEAISLSANTVAHRVNDLAEGTYKKREDLGVYPNTIDQKLHTSRNLLF
jgi:hypothetical protein